MFDLFKKREILKEYNLSDDELDLRVTRVSDNQYMYGIYLKGTNKQVGYCDLRLGHNQSLYYFGNIGYRVLPAYRGHEYAYKACKMLFSFAKKINMDYLIITVSPENIPSVKTCQKLGGECVEVAKVPPWHSLYSMNERTKMIFKYNLRNYK